MKALAKGLMGAAYGGLAGLHDAWKTEQTNIQTQRLLAAKALEEQKLAEIKAQYLNAKDAKDHEQAKEIKDLEISAADKRAAETAERADKRAESTNASRERAAATRANRPSSAGKPAWKPVKDGDAWIYVDATTNKPVLDESGVPRQAPPPYRERGAPAVKPTGMPAKPGAAPAVDTGPEPVFVPPPPKGSKPIGPRTRADVREQIRPVTSQAEADELLAQARLALQKNADPEQVRARLRQYGLSLKD